MYLAHPCILAIGIIAGTTGMATTGVRHNGGMPTRDGALANAMPAVIIGMAVVGSIHRRAVMAQAVMAGITTVANAMMTTTIVRSMMTMTEGRAIITTAMSTHGERAMATIVALDTMTGLIRSMATARMAEY